MNTPRGLSLYWRLLVSYLLVIIVTGVTLYFASEALAPAFLDWHLDHIEHEARADHTANMHLEADLTAAHRQAMQQAVFWSVLAATVVAGALSLFVAGRIASPLRKMQRASARIAAGTYQERLKVPSTDEVGELAVAFNHMAQALQETEQRRVELLANVAHEFRTPLSSLNGYLEGLEDGYFPASAETFDACKRQLHRMERLMEDLSLLSRVEAGHEPINPVPTDVHLLLEQLASSVQPQFLKKDVRLTVMPPAGEMRVHADPQRTLQVLTNLTTNALRHTPTGQQVRVSVHPLSHDMLRFEVVDTGEGIPAKVLPHIFTRFYRADRSRTRQDGGGTGIGLTIAKHYVERQGGSIGVDSTLGQGSRFWFTLPRVSNP